MLEFRVVPFGINLWSVEHRINSYHTDYLWTPIKGPYAYKDVAVKIATALAKREMRKVKEQREADRRKNEESTVYFTPSPTPYIFDVIEMKAGKDINRRQIS